MRRRRPPTERSHNESALRLCRLPCCLEDIHNHAVSLFSRLGRPIGVSHDIRVVRRQHQSSLDPVVSIDGVQRVDIGHEVRRVLDGDESSHPSVVNIKPRHQEPTHRSNHLGSTYEPIAALPRPPFSDRCHVSAAAADGGSSAFPRFWLLGASSTTSCWCFMTDVQ